MDPAPRFGAIGSLDRAFTSRRLFKDKAKERKEDTENTVRNALVRDCDVVWGHSNPPDNRNAAATALTNRIAAAFEADIAGPETQQNIQRRRAQQFNTWALDAAAGIDEVDPDDNRRKFRLNPVRVEVPGGPPRLLLPFSKRDKKVGGADDGIRPDITLCLRGIDSIVGLQGGAHYCDATIVVEVKADPDDLIDGVAQLGRYELHVLRSQCDCRGPIGIVVCGSTAYIVVFGNDNVWMSTGANLATVDGRRAMIAQVVNWSLCTIDRLGRDSTVTRLSPQEAAAEAAVAPAQVPPAEAAPAQAPPAEAAPAQVPPPPPPPRIIYRFTIGGTNYYSHECQKVADAIVGKRLRRILLWQTGEMVGPSTHMLLDYWARQNEDEAEIIRRIRAILGGNPERANNFPRIIAVERVRQRREEGDIIDDTETAYGGLNEWARNAAGEGGHIMGAPYREHLRILIEFPGNVISEAVNDDTVVVVLAQAIAALSAINTHVRILHRDVTADNICHRIVAGELQCILMGFTNTIDSTPDNPQPDRLDMIATLALQSMRSLENPGAVRTLLDDLESLLYLVCWLGTFGVNQADREAYIAGLPKDTYLPIMDWNQGTAIEIAGRKRDHLATLAAFRSKIISNMRENSPLRPLAVDMYRALFLHPGCYGTTLLTDNSIARIEDGNIRAALLAIPVINGTRNPLILRHAVLVALIANILGSLPQH
ncbi:hypothetical protein GGF41_001336 [Coemansia sp. RSA 2531]|nr:hypothetical protein GGF41_001336 [Coemansia sp. RSA 2531]